MPRLAPEGWPFLAPGLILTALAVGGAVLVPPGGSGWVVLLWPTAGVLAVLTAFTAFFFRNPLRRHRGDEGLVLAPADGRIVHITPVDDPAGFVPSANRISIFLSVFDVHVQRSPITGRVERKEYRPGRFAMAWKEKASQDNEQATLSLAAGPHRVLVRQIAGWVARRIVTDPEEGDMVSQGSRIGLIRFGSRVDLFLPREWELTCAVGDRTQGGLTPLARLPDAGGGEPA